MNAVENHMLDNLDVQIGTIALISIYLSLNKYISSKTKLTKELIFVFKKPFKVG